MLQNVLCRDDRIPGKSMVPLLSASTSLIMSCNSDSEGFWPSERITVPSSLVVIWPVVAKIHQYHVVTEEHYFNSEYDITVGANRMVG